MTRRRALALGAGLGAGGALTGLAGCSADSRPPRSDRAPAAPTPSGPVRRVEQYGATGDGRTDDTAALQRALAAVRPGERLLLAEGRTYLHADVLVLAVPGVLLGGAGTLLATREDRSALQVEAADVTVADLTLAVRSTTRRWDAPAQHRLYVGRRPGVVLSRVSVTGSAAAGVFLAGSTGFRVEDVSVADTRADGVHLTQGARDGVVVSPRTARTGDDGVAVVSYLQDGAVCGQIEISRPRVDTTRGGRGISVVGGEDVTYTDIDVRGSAAAGVYLACEPDPFNTAPTRRVRVLRGTVAGANTDTRIDHGAVLVYAGSTTNGVTDVEVRDLVVSGVRTSASRQVGVIGSTSGVRLLGLAVQGAPTPFTSTERGCCQTSGWKVDGRAREVS